MAKTSEHWPLALGLILVTLTAAVGGCTAATAATAYSRCGKKAEPVNELCYAVDNWLMTNEGWKEAGDRAHYWHDLHERRGEHDAARKNQEQIERIRPLVGELVIGSSIQIDSFSAHVPGWASGDFVSNASWVTFAEGKHWVTSGQLAGDYWDEDSLHYFWAFQNHDGYSEEQFSGGPATNTWNTYTMQYANKPYTWNIFINGTNVGSATGLGTTSDNLQAGLVMTNTNIRNSGETRHAKSYSTRGLWSSAWGASGSGDYATPESEGPEGVAPNCVYPLAGAPRGDIYFGAQPCGRNGGTEPLRTPNAKSAAAFGAASPFKAIRAGRKLIEPELKKIALLWSRREGDGNPSRISIVHAPRSVALAVTMPGMRLPSAPSREETQWLKEATVVVVIRGEFRAKGRIPAGEKAPSGTILSLVIDARTGEVSGRHIGSKDVNLASLGSVDTFK